MRALFALTAALLSYTVLAEEFAKPLCPKVDPRKVCYEERKKVEKTPDYLKDGLIVVELANGEKHPFSTNKWKVVPRNSPSRKKFKPKVKVVEKVVKEKVEVFKKNEIAIHAGTGYDGLDIKREGIQVQVRELTTFVYGATYTRRFNQDWSVKGTALSNDTYLIGGGFSW